MTQLKYLLLEVVCFVLGLFLKLLSPVLMFFKRAIRLAYVRIRTSARVPVSTQFDGPVRIVGTGNIEFGPYCRLGHQVVLETQGSGSIRLGQHVRINAGTHIVAHYGISIGDDALIGEYVSIRDANHGTQLGDPMRLQAHSGQKIHIGSDTWVGRGSCVLQGGAMEDGAVLGANSLLNTRLRTHEIAVGCPAKVVKTRKRA